jgi:hypothetical protein
MGSGVWCQVSELIELKLCMKLHHAVKPRMRFRLAGTVNRLNVERPTSNVEY